MDFDLKNEFPKGFSISSSDAGCVTFSWNWISIKDRLPDSNEWVLVSAKKTEEIDGPLVFCASHGRCSRGWDCAYGDGYIPQEVEITHWMPLPNPPEVKE